MIWKELSLINFVQQVGDELGNMVSGKPDEVYHTYCRETPWTDEQIAIEGRDVTKNEQRFIVPYSGSKLPEFDAFVVDGVTYQPTDTMRLNPRYMVLQGKVYKDDGLYC